MLGTQCTNLPLDTSTYGAMAESKSMNHNAAADSDTNSYDQTQNAPSPSRVSLFLESFKLVPSS